MILWLYRWINGYLIISISADSPEKFLNLCAANGLHIWGIYLKGQKLYFKIGIQNFRRLRQVCRKVSGSAHIVQKRGLPFWVAGHKKRYGVPIGVVLFFALLYLLSGFVWNICVTGVGDNNKNEIICGLKKIGIQEGSRISQIDVKTKRNELLLYCQNISWASLNVEGCKLTVNATPKKTVQPADNAPANLVAKCDGVITKNQTTAGTTVIEVGDTVTKGQLLVSSMIEYADLHTEFVKADGKIFAKTVHEYSIFQPFEIMENKRTGRVINHKVLNFFGLQMPLYAADVFFPYECTTKKPKINNENNYLPIYCYEKTFFETQNQKISISENQAKERLKNELKKRLNQQMSDGKVLSENVKFSVTEQGVLLTATLHCEENIILSQKIVKDAGNQG